MREKIRELWEFRYLVYNLVMRNLKIKYRGSSLGFLWSLLNPLLMISVYTLAFQYVIHISIPNFPIFLFCALLPWNFLTLTLGEGTDAIIANGNLVKKVYFPREVLPLAVVMVNLFHFLLTFIILLPALLFFHIQPTAALLFLPVLILFHTLFIMGLTLFIATLCVYYRDIKHLVGVLLQLWFWLTPIVWSIRQLPESLRGWAYANPYTIIISAYRDVILAGRTPEPVLLLFLIFFSLTVFAAGASFFYKKQRRFAEEL